MSSSAFKKRFLASLPEVPAELDLQIDEFVQFPATAVNELKIRKADKAILNVSGLPKQAAPFLSFGFPDEPDMLKPVSRECGLPDDQFGQYKMIGQNGYGDLICIDDSNGGAVVYLNHDRNNEVVFMNSSVSKFAECLCLFSEFRRSRDAGVCRRGIQNADPKAMEESNFWPREISSLEK